MQQDFELQNATSLVDIQEEIKDIKKKFVSLREKNSRIEKDITLSQERLSELEKVARRLEQVSDS